MFKYMYELPTISTIAWIENMRLVGRIPPRNELSWVGQDVVPSCGNKFYQGLFQSITDVSQT